MCARPRGEIEKTERERSVGWKASRWYSEARSFSSNAKVKRGMGVGQRAAARWRGWWYAGVERRREEEVGERRRRDARNETAGNGEETGREKERPGVRLFSVV